ncbi:MAG TPA: hypothetical protein PLQ93_03005 [Bacteroidia bacterium]|nr:hypothetical protein [Bacteroidia bacterium]
MKVLRIFLFTIGLILILFSCQKNNQRQDDNPAPPENSYSALSVSYRVDNLPLLKDSLMYTNAAGNVWSLQRLNYFLSQIALIKADSSTEGLLGYCYVDGLDISKNTFTLGNIKPGDYIGLSFNIGLDSLLNRPDALPSVTELNNMVWPEPMGGGYHVLKLEGYFRNAGSLFGYALHLGTNACRIPIRLFKHIQVKSGEALKLNLSMNVNEWFMNPYQYDLDQDGNYTMGNAVLMMKIAGNGKDVFTLY